MTDQSTPVERADFFFGQQEVTEVVKLPLVMGNRSKPMDQIVIFLCTSKPIASPLERWGNRFRIRYSAPGFGPSSARVPTLPLSTYPFHGKGKGAHWCNKANFTSYVRISFWFLFFYKWEIVLNLYKINDQNMLLLSKKFNNLGYIPIYIYICLITYESSETMFLCVCESSWCKS